VKALQGAGIATLRFNFRGAGGSGGTHDDGRGEVDDVKAAVACLHGRSAAQTIVVAGYSFGAYVGLKAGAADARVHKLIGIALPAARRDVSFVRGITKPKVLISGDRDDVSPLPKLEALRGEGADPAGLVVIPGADHFFWGLEDRAAAAAVAFVAGRRLTELS
jgi:alpha/beta superfamily hydrolase